MDRKTFMRELEFLLQDMNEDERNDALSFYQGYFEEAGIENESKVIEELGEPSRIAAIIKAGLDGNFDQHIQVGNDGFSNEDYQRNYEVIDVENENKSSNHILENFKEKWKELCSRDRIFLLVIFVIALLPLGGMISGFFELGFSLAIFFFCIVFGFWIITIILYIIAVIMIIVGVYSLLTIPAVGLIYLGIGCILVAFAHIFHKIASWFFKKCIPYIIEKLSQIFNKFIRKEGVAS